MSPARLPRASRAPGVDPAPDAHGVRPTDLVALVTFDGQVYENHAVTREHLARPGEAPRPLGAAIEQWLGRGRRTWIDVRGRQIEGIATAREVAEGVWGIDTLIDASNGSREDEVLRALLRQAQAAAVNDEVTHVLLRTHAESPALLAAMRCGYKQVLVEEVWRGELRRPEASPPALEIRDAGEADELARFQLFNRILPLDAREAFALTLDEWRRTRERRWLGRGGIERVALAGGNLVGVLLAGNPGEDVQLELCIDGDHPEAAEALLDHAARLVAGRRRSTPVLAVVPAAVPAAGAALRARGLERAAEYVLLCLRLQKLAGERRRVRAGMAVPTRG